MPFRFVDASVLGALIFGEPKAEEIARALGDSSMASPALIWFEWASICLRKVKAHPAQREQILRAFRVAGKLSKGLSTGGQLKAPRMYPRIPRRSRRIKGCPKLKSAQKYPPADFWIPPTFQSPSKYPPRNREKEKRSLNGLLAASFGQKVDIYFSLRGTTLLFFSFLSLTKTYSLHLLFI